MDNGIFLAYCGAALAAAGAGIGSAIGCGISGRAGAGVLSEDPDRFGSILILTALPGTQGIYGFVIFLFMVVTTLPKGVPTIGQGWEFLFAGLPIALAGGLSGVHQGRVCAAGVNMLAKRPDQFGRAIVLGVIVEFYAILGFLASLMMVQRITLG